MLVVSSLLSNFTWCACGMKSNVDKTKPSHLFFKSEYFNLSVHGKKNNLTAKRKRLTAKLLQYREDISYFFCREVVVILFAVRFFFLP